jgi:hypothetical protein
VGLRVSRDEEREGLDPVLHGESAYELGPLSGGASHELREADERAPDANLALADSTR